MKLDFKKHVEILKPQSFVDYAILMITVVLLVSWVFK